MGVRVNLRGIRTDLAAACGGLGFTLYDHWPGDLETPAVVVTWPDSIRFTGTLAGGAVVSIDVLIVLGRADDEAAQTRLDDILSGDLIDNLQNARSPHWAALEVVEARNIRTQTAAATEVLTCDLALEIITTP
jgi:hypothetical protein